MADRRVINSKIAYKLESICPEAKTAYEDSIHTINTKDHGEIWVHWAHSLRESIALTVKPNAETKVKSRRRPTTSRYLALLNLARKNKVKNKKCCRNLVKQYKALSNIAHHCPRPNNPVDRKYANNMLTRVENNLKIIFNIDKTDTRTQGD